MRHNKNVIMLVIEENLPRLNLSYKVSERSMAILKKMSKDEFIDIPFSQNTVAATLIYMSSILESEKRTQEAIAHHTILANDCSIRNCAKYIMEKWNITC